jgi:hypothetical protein
MMVYVVFLWTFISLLHFLYSSLRGQGLTQIFFFAGKQMLIWAGAPLYDNQNVFDFKPVTTIDEDTHLSFIVSWAIDESHKGWGMIVDKTYNTERQVGVLNDLHDFNMHEFNVLPGGKTALACTYRPREVNLADFGRPTEQSWIMAGGFVELDTETSEVLVEWDSFDKVALLESNVVNAGNSPSQFPGWDYVHINSVDKNEAGDYIISLRFTNTLYCISGEDGHIMWRLGGLESDFALDFTFSKQHDVKWLSSNGTHHVVSFLNNASDEGGNDEAVSAALFVEVDTIAMTAKVIKRINRPDSGLTRLRGNVQLLPNDNVFVGWSERGYQSEHAPNGDLLMTARFVSERYSTYRAYKAEFIGRPSTPPDLVASVYGTTNVDTTTLIHVSWNGATDVVGWKFYAQAYDRGSPVLIGHANKTDFETMYIVDGFMDWITAEAIDREGRVMGTSRVTRSEIPKNWKAVGFVGSSTGPKPDDPAILSPVNKGSSSVSSSYDSVDTTNGMADMVNDHSSTYADAKEVAKAVYKAYEVIRGVGGLLIFILLACTVGGLVTCLWRMFKRRKMRSYQHIPSEEGVPVEEIHLRSHAE